MSRYLLLSLVLLFIAITFATTTTTTTPTSEQSAMLSTLNKWKCTYTQQPETYFQKYSQCLEQHAQKHADEMAANGKINAGYSERNSALCDGTVFNSISIATSSQNSLALIVDSMISLKSDDFVYTNDFNASATAFVTSFLWKSNYAVGCARNAKYISCMVAPKIGGVLSMMNYEENFTTYMTQLDSSAKNTQYCTENANSSEITGSYTIYSDEPAPEPTDPVDDVPIADPTTPTPTTPNDGSTGETTTTGPDNTHNLDNTNNTNNTNDKDHTDDNTNTGDKGGTTAQPSPSSACKFGLSTAAVISFGAIAILF